MQGVPRRSGQLVPNGDGCVTKVHQVLDAMSRRQGAFHVWKMMPPQRSHGPGQGIGSAVVVVAPHVKQIQA
jgi:hypothetical protein